MRYVLSAFVVASIWLFGTCFIDFLVIPHVFQTVSDIHQAGQVGVGVFGRFNYFELFFGILIFVWALKFGQKIERILTVWLLAIPAWYLSSATPQIAKASRAMIEHKESNDALYSQAEEILQTYHSLYVKVDSVKIILLLICLWFVIKQMRNRLHLKSDL